MTRIRMFGSDNPFGAWLRRHSDELPSYSDTCGFVASDNDWHIHRYLTETDSLGTREIQGMMFLEVKSRNGEIPKSQLDTLVKLHCSIKFDTEYCGQVIRHFGVSFLILSGTDPDDSETMRWGRFRKFASGQRHVTYRPITKECLFELLRFERHPDNFTKRVFRRHHQTRNLVEVIQAPLGFKYEKPVVKRS